MTRLYDWFLTKLIGSRSIVANVTYRVPQIATGSNGIIIKNCRFEA